MDTGEILKIGCPTCAGLRACDVHGRYLHEWEWEDDYSHVSGRNEHLLLRCRGCETVFYACKSSNSEDFDQRYHPITGEIITQYSVETDTYPKLEQGKRRPEWFKQPNELEPRFSLILAEMYQARDSRSFILASIGLRTAFDRASELLGVPPEETFEMKVQSLHRGGYIGESEAKILGLLADAGSAAAHRGWSPSEEDFDGLLAALEHFVERNLVTGLGVMKIAESIPPRPPRKKKPKPEPEPKPKPKPKPKARVDAGTHLDAAEQPSGENPQA